MLFRLKMTLALVYYNVVEKITVMKRATARSRPTVNVSCMDKIPWMIRLSYMPN